MNSRHIARQSLLIMKVVSHKKRLLRLKILSAATLALMLIINVLPAAAVSIPIDLPREPNLQTASTLTINSEADAYVEELHPGTNNGASDHLQVESASNRNTESYIRFTVSGVAGTVQDAKLRVYTTVNSTSNGPAVYAASNTWIEAGITWNNHP